MDRPTPEQYQPPLTPWMHAWRMAAMLAASALVWSWVVKPQAERQPVLLVADILIGITSFVVVHWRRRHPVAVGYGLNIAAVFSGLASGPALLAAVSLATRRRTGEVLGLAVVIFTASTLFWVVQPYTERTPWWFMLISNALFATLQVGWGMYIGSRRELIWELRRRAELAETERDERVRRARVNERAWIAREMHDVLAHRISQISMHAGAMAFRDDLPREQLREGAAEIQRNANLALTDLRDVLGVLRSEEGGARSETAPQPTYADLPRLVDGARSNGMEVVFDELLASEPTSIPRDAGRTVYRIVQEGLTNAAKHAPGAVVTVSVEGAPEVGLDVRLSNPVGVVHSLTPGSGLGLVGLEERAALRGGSLDHHVTDSTFVLHGWIPWSA